MGGALGRCESSRLNESLRHDLDTSHVTLAGTKGITVRSAPLTAKLSSQKQTCHIRSGVANDVAHAERWPGPCLCPCPLRKMATCTMTCLLVVYPGTLVAGVRYKPQPMPFMVRLRCKRACAVPLRSPSLAPFIHGYRDRTPKDGTSFGS